MEKWKDIEGYEGLYQVSNEGRVKSLNFNRTGEERLLKLTINCRNGYLYVNLHKEGKAKHHRVHRLVAQAFIPNPDNLSEVNHKNEDKTNNHVENLEWCSREYNVNYGTRNQRVTETMKNRPDQSIPIDMLTKDGEFIRQFPSANEAKRWLRANGLPKAGQSSISVCCNGKLKSAYGYKWNYSNNF